ncbi:MAG TPA: TlpA disulfide reductase family protein [Acidobacteriaceae bacterium]|nr:TlpA disulfide reductase family protein [Acidobacteriaceae bacterium]
MMKLASCILGSLVLFGAAALSGQATESSITEQVDGLRALPDAQRWLTTAKIAMDIRTLPAGLPKLRLADALAHLSTEGDAGRATLQAVADTLAQALKEAPQPADADGDPAAPYTDLAKLVRYEGVTADLGDPMLARANDVLEANDADVAKADFTLQDLRGKEYTLSALKGKTVLVNFWATWCPPCRKEMKDLDSIYTRYRSRGLVILSITSEEPDPVMNFLSSVHYHPPILIDEDGRVAKQFHVDGLPRTFVFDRSGRLCAQTIDMRTQRQFFAMLAKAGFHPAGN